MALTLVVARTEDVRRLIEAILNPHARNFELIRSSMADSETTLVYAVRARKGQRLAELAQAMQVEGVPYVAKATAEQWM